MSQPEFVPVKPVDNVRSEPEMPAPDGWFAQRPAEIATVFQPVSERLGNPGPDQGYGVKLAKRMALKAKVAEHEHLEDAVAGCLGVGLRRAAIFGRAPVIFDYEHAFTLWGFLDTPPVDLIEFRKSLFQACAHNYWDQRAIVDAVPESTLRLSHTDIAARIGDWRSLINVG